MSFTSIMLNYIYMHSRHAKCTVEIYFLCLMFLKFQKYICVSTKLTLGVMGLKITTLSQEPVNHVLIVK